MKLSGELVIDSKIQSRATYPWFFFYRIARLTLVVFLPTLFLILFLYRSSYRQGLVSQMSLQIKEDLVLIQHTLKNHQISWEEWCQELPEQKDIRYTLFKADGQIICGAQGNFEGLENLKIKEFRTDLRNSAIFGTQAIISGMRLDQDHVLKKVIAISSLRDNMDRFDRVLFLRIVPFAILSYFIFIIFFYLSTKPLGVILSKVEKFKNDIPFNKSLELLYERDEWGALEEALNKADQRLQAQVEEATQEIEKNTAILEAINDAIIAVDKFESILFFNSKFQNNFIRQREGQEILKKVWHIFNDDVLNAFRCVLQTGEARALKAMNFPQSHNPGRFFDLKITPLTNSEGKVTGALGVFYDVTDFKLTEQMRVDFVANVSHEIRTPLTSIKGFTQILESQSDKIDQSLRPFLDKIVANTERMISLFNDLLSLSVIESRNDLRKEEVELSEIVHEVESNIKANYPDKNINFSSELELKSVRGDYRLIEQVILNLCDNACKYSDQDVTITIASHSLPLMEEITIQDNGPGISQEHLSRIFERFYRVDASREGLRGTGLGLSIVKQIITKHKGKISARSEGPGKGTTFVIELPKS